METGVRADWLGRMLKIADPVITNLAENKLKENMPDTFNSYRREFMHLEAWGRTVQGIAPWLALENVEGEEKLLQEKYRRLAVTAMENAVDPNAADYMNFTEGYGQALVDAAFLSHGILRAPKQLFFDLSEEGRANLVSALKATRRFTPFVSNWLFFSAMVETALYIAGEEYDMTRIEYAVRMFEKWYVGDGTYSDGDRFHWDYYNSFVIHPMYTDILRTFKSVRTDYEELYETCLKRAARYAGVLEQMIAPDGTYTVIGRSVTYRFGAFHALSHAVLHNNLPKGLPNGQVRSALTAVIHRVMESPRMFDENGWLLPGVYGEQPSLAEGYICVGSLYLCLAVFLPLGLPDSHPFWQEKDSLWTAAKIWSGMDIPCDHAED